MVNETFWRGRRVLVTGHTGFKGSWLSEWLLVLGAHPIGYALAPPTEPALFDHLCLRERIDHNEGDIRDLARLREVIERARPEIIFHLAAQPLVRRSYAAPLETLAVNVLGTANVLEVCRSLPSVRAVVSVTSDKCYQQREWGSGHRETDQLGGDDPYSSSKACAELVTHSYRHSFFATRAANQGTVSIASVRAGNVIGGGDWAMDRLVPDAIRAFERACPVAIRYPEFVRPWQHVLEPLHGYLRLAMALCGDNGRRFAKAWNFGPAVSDAKSVRWVVERLCELWPTPATWMIDPVEHTPESRYLALDSGQARAELGWGPLLTIDQVLGMTVEWYRSHRRDPGVTRRQIAEYMRIAEAVGCANRECQ